MLIISSATLPLITNVILLVQLKKCVRKRLSLFQRSKLPHREVKNAADIIYFSMLMVLIGLPLTTWTIYSYLNDGICFVCLYWLQSAP